MFVFRYSGSLPKICSLFISDQNFVRTSPNDQPPPKSRKKLTQGNASSPVANAESIAAPESNAAADHEKKSSQRENAVKSILRHPCSRYGAPLPLSQRAPARPRSLNDGGNGGGKKIIVQHEEERNGRGDGGYGQPTSSDAATYCRFLIKWLIDCLIDIFIFEDLACTCANCQPSATWPPLRINQLHRHKNEMFVTLNMYLLGLGH